MIVFITSKHINNFRWHRAPVLPILNINQGNLIGIESERLGEFPQSYLEMKLNV